MAISKINKSDVRRELGNKTIDELNDVIDYHQQKAATNQRIVAIAKLMLKNKMSLAKDSVLNLAAKNLEVLHANESNEATNSSTDNAQPEQLSDSIDSENSL